MNFLAPKPNWKILGWDVDLVQPTPYATLTSRPASIKAANWSMQRRDPRAILWDVAEAARAIAGFAAVLDAKSYSGLGLENAVAEL